MNTKKYKTIFIYMVLVLMLAGEVRCGFGKSGWIIFRKIQSSRFFLNTVSSSLDTDVSGMLCNPAYLGRLNKSEISLISEMGSIGDAYGSVIIGYPMQNISIGGLLAYYNSGEVELNWLDGAQLQSRKVCAQSDMLIAVSASKSISEAVDAGVTIKTARSIMAEDESAYSVVADAGVHIAPAEKVNISASIQNYGYSSKFKEERSRTPQSIFAGAGYGMSCAGMDICLSGGMIYYLYEEEIAPAAGIELKYGDLLMGAGYRFSGEEHNLQASMTFNLKNTALGYAYIPGLYLDAVHRISLRYRFGK